MVQFRRASRIALLTAGAYVLATLPVSAQAQDDGPSRFGPWVLIGLLLAGALVLGYFNFKAHQPFHLTRTTSLPVDDVLERLVARYTIKGWQVPSRTDRGATFYRRSEPSILITLLLFVLGIVPGLLYLLLGGRDLTVSAQTRLHDNGKADIEIVGNGKSDGSLRIAAGVLDGLP